MTERNYPQPVEEFLDELFPFFEKNNCHQFAFMIEGDPENIDVQIMWDSFYEVVGEQVLSMYLKHGEPAIAEDSDDAQLLLAKWITKYSLNRLENEGLVHKFEDDYVISDKGERYVNEHLTDEDE